MNTATPFPTIASLAERIAWMHEPVHLGSVRLPWFLRWYYEQAVHRMFCTLERMLLTLLERQLQGKLAASPDPAEDAPRRTSPRYKMKFAPAAPTRDVGCAAVELSAAAAEPEPEVDADALANAETDVAADADADTRAANALTDADTLAAMTANARTAHAAPAGMPVSDFASLRMAKRAACPRRGHQQSRPAWGHVAKPRDRCRNSTFCKPAWVRRQNCA